MIAILAAMHCVKDIEAVAFYDPPYERTLSVPSHLRKNSRFSVFGIHFFHVYYDLFTQCDCDFLSQQVGCVVFNINAHIVQLQQH